MTSLCSTSRGITSYSTLSAPRPQRSRVPACRAPLVVRAHKVEIEHEGTVHVLEVPENKPILEVALEKGIDLPHDCKLGVCMTCPAKLVAGTVDQTGCMLSDDVVEKGFALLCMALPRSDCRITTISEDELLDEQLCA